MSSVLAIAKNFVRIAIPPREIVFGYTRSTKGAKLQHCSIPGVVTGKGNGARVDAIRVRTTAADEAG
jgi:hypothetical protein